MWAGQERVDSINKVLPAAEGRKLVDLLASLTWELEHLGKYQEALISGTRALKLADSLEYEYGQAACLNHLGALYKGMGNFPVAMDHLQRSEKLFVKTDSKRGVASVKLNLGNLFSSMGWPDKAMEKYRESFSYGEKAKDTVVMAVCLGNIGTIHHTRNELKEAEEYYKRSLKLRELIRDRAGAATIYNNLGIICFDKGDLEGAKNFYELYLTIAIEENLDVDRITGSLNLGELYCKTGRFEDGLGLLESGLQLALKINSKELEKAAYDTYCIVWNEKNDAEKTLYYSELLRAVKDTILNKANSRAIAEMETRFETEKKEQEIDLLQKDNSIRDISSKMKDDELLRKDLFKFSSYGALALLGGILVFTVVGIREKKKIFAKLSVLNKEIILQHDIIEQKNQMINDSIEYAGTIQEALSHDEEEIRKVFGSFRMKTGLADGIANFVYALEDIGGIRILFMVHSHFPGVSGSLHSLRIFHELRNLCMLSPKFEPAIVTGFLANLPRTDFNLLVAFTTSHNGQLHLIGHDCIFSPSQRKILSSGKGIVAWSPAQQEKVFIFSTHPSPAAERFPSDIAELERSRPATGGKSYVALQFT